MNTYEENTITKLRERVAEFGPRYKEQPPTFRVTEVETLLNVIESLRAERKELISQINRMRYKPS